MGTCTRHTYLIILLSDPRRRWGWEKKGELLSSPIAPSPRPRSRPPVNRRNGFRGFRGTNAMRSDTFLLIYSRTQRLLMNSTRCDGGAVIEYHTVLIYLRGRDIFYYFPFESRR